jgi:pterin-4a-carbinolamine dehydratase
MSTTQEVKITTTTQDGTREKPRVRLRRPPRRPTDQLERGLTPQQVQNRLKAERVQEELRTMPGWKLGASGKVIDRVHEFPEVDVAMGYAGFVQRYAKSLNLPVTVSVSGGVVRLALSGTRYLTKEVLNFARRLG